MVTLTIRTSLQPLIKTRIASLTLASNTPPMHTHAVEMCHRYVAGDVI